MVSGRDQTFFREAPFAAERSGVGDLRSTFCCGAKRSWRLAKLLLLRSEAELETCEAPFWAALGGLWAVLGAKS